MSDYGYVRCRTVAEAHAVDTYLQATAARMRPVPSSEELARERETLRLREEFVRLDILVLDSLSRTGDTRDKPLPPWRKTRYQG